MNLKAKTYLCLVFVLLVHSMLFAQKKASIDSLKNTIRFSPVLDKVKNLNKISKLYSNTNLDSAISYANKSIAISAQNKLYAPLATAYNFLGQYMYGKSNYQASLANFEKFKTFALLANESELIIQAINNIATVYIDIGKTNEAIKQFEEVLVLSKKNNDKKGLSLGYGNLAYVYRYIGDNNKAITYLFEEIKIDESIKNNAGLAHCYQQLAVLYHQKNDLNNEKIYLDLSLVKFKEVTDWRSVAITYDLYSSYYISLKNRDKAIEVEKLAIELAEKQGDKRSIAIFTSKLGELYFEDEQYALAEQNLAKSIKLHEQINLQKTIAGAYIWYAKSLLRLQKYDLAKANFDKGLNIAIAQKSAVDKKDAYQGITEYYLKVNEPDKALKNQSLFMAIKDSLLNDNNNKQINELNTKYQTEKKENQIVLLSKENQIQGLELNRSELELANRALLLDKSNLEIGSKNLLLERNKVELSKKQVETKAKEQKIKLLDSENQIQKLELLKRNITIGIIFGVFLLTCFIGILFYNRFKLKQESRLQQEVIKQQDMATKAVLIAEENERKRISSELHDGLGQMFSAVKMNLSAMSENIDFKDAHGEVMFDKTLSLVDESCKEVRVIAHQMAPNVLLKSGLTAAVRDFISKIDARKLKINLETFGLHERIDQNTETVLYRVIQESVNNVIKHAHADSLDIQLGRDEEGIQVMIEDNGRGFDTSKAEHMDGLGLKNMTSRVAYLKGTVDFSSQIGHGTLVAIHIPYKLYT